MATVLLPRSLLALFPGVERRHEVPGDSVAAVIEALDATVPGLRDRLVESGPRLLSGEGREVSLMKGIVQSYLFNFNLFGLSARRRFVQSESRKVVSPRN